MHSPDAPPLPQDNVDSGFPEHGFPSPDDQPTVELPVDDQAIFDQEFAEIAEQNGDLEARAEIAAEAFRKQVGRVAIANTDGTAPKSGTKWENRLRPETPYYGWIGFKRLSPGHPHRHTVNAVKPKVEASVKNREKGFLYGDHEESVTEAVSAIRSLNIKQHVNEFNPTSRTSWEGTVDHTGHRRTGYGTVQFRRPLSRLATNLRLIRSPEKQVDDERKISLRQIGAMYGLDEAMADVARKDESGRFAETLRSGNPQAVRHELGALSSNLTISEHNPLHARWSEAMEPRNVQRFRRWVIENSSKEETGVTPEASVLHIAAVGIMGSVRPRAVADYLGVSFEEWDEQRHGFLDGNENHAVPKEVVDQICFLIKLDSRLVGGKVTGEDGQERPRTALDVMIASGAAEPMTAVRRGEGHKTPMDRVADPDAMRARIELERADRERADRELMNALADIDLEEFGRRYAELNADDAEDAAELERMTKQRAGIIRRFRSAGIATIPASLNTREPRS